MKPGKYPKSLIIIHWLTVVLFAVIFFIGINMEKYEFNEENFNYYRTHALMGMALMVLTVIRIIIKRKNINNLPAEIRYFSNTHKVIATTVQRFLILLLIIAPITGFIMVYQTGALAYDLGGPFPENPHFNETLKDLHKFIVFTLLGLIIMHVAGIIAYKLRTKENLLKRMCLFL